MKPRKLLSDGEFETRKRIESASKEHSAECFSLVRVADVVGDLHRSSLTNQQMSFALKAHFDFVICDTETHPLFIIEYDGATHSQEDQIRRDALKDDICRIIGIPFVRIDSRHLFRWKEDIVRWLVDYWFFSRMLIEAQQNGDFPEDELPDPFWLGGTKAEDPIFPMMLGLKYRASIQRAHQKGDLENGIAFEWIGESDEHDGRYSAIAAIKIKEETWVVASTRLTAYDFGTFPSDLISELVIMELFKMLRAYFSDPTSLFVTSETVSLLLQRAMKGCHMCQCGGGHGNLSGLTIPDDIRKKFGGIMP